MSEDILIPKHDSRGHIMATCNCRICKRRRGEYVPTRKYPTKVITVYMPMQLYEKLQQLQDLGKFGTRNRTGFITDALWYYIRNKEEFQ